MTRAALLIACGGLACWAADKASFIVTAVSHETAVRESTSIFRNPTLSNTSCNGTGMNTGPMSTAQVNCQTVTQGGGSQAVTTRKLDVENIVDANGERFTIRCTANWIGSNCLPMKDGDQFQAEYDGKITMWITARKGGNLGKPVSAKYKVLDRRPVPTVAGSSAIVAAALDAARAKHPDFDQYDQEMRSVADKLPHGKMTLDEYIEALYVLAKANGKP
jgi:hypothetical protein